MYFHSYFRHALLWAAVGLAPLIRAANVDFATQVQPILEAKCLECHNPEKIKGKLLLDTAEHALKGGENGPAFVAGQPEKSDMIHRVALPKGDDDAMPPKKPLEKVEIDTLKRWVAEGAVWPKEVTLHFQTPEKIKALADFEQKKSTLKRIAFYPNVYSLETKRDFHRVVVQAIFEDATTQDVTPLVQMQVDDAKLAKLDGDMLYPLDDGTTQVTAKIANTSATASVVVKQAKEDRPVSFHLDVMPVFMRGGCNQGGCHGAARGKDGFRLSLFGMDPDGDYNRITREMAGRRLNLAIPEESTLIEKATGTVPHSGNQCFGKDTSYYRDIIEWITNGAPADKPDVATVTGIEIFPKQAVLEGHNAKQRITVRATYSDGTDRDVSNLALFMSNNDPVASVSKDGLINSGDRGAAFIMARFNVYTTNMQVIVIPENLKYERPKLAEANYIDGLVDERLHKLRIYPSGICSDQEFIRRASIDIIGVYPKPDDIRSFVADKNPNKREAMIDALLQRKEFTDLWVMKWAELLQIRSGVNNNTAPFYKNALLYYNWLADRIGRNVPFNQIVIELLSANGGTVSNPPVNFYQMEIDPLKITENVAQVFMGMRIQCSQCHNHPFDRWTMNDYYSFKAFFTQIGRKQTDDPQEVVIYNSKGGESTHFLTGKVMKPKFLGGDTPDLQPGQDRRKSLAEWIASPKNPYFATNVANIMWAHFFGVGIVDPVDDVRISNPPSNPELLDALGKHLTDYNYDFRKMVKDICMSMTYQRTSEANETNVQDRRNFAHALVRRVRAEVLLDAISTITNRPDKFQGLPLGARAVQIADGAVTNYFLTTFGRATRTTVCSCEVKMEPTLSQALHLMNGDVVHQRIKQGRVVQTLISQKKSDQEIIEELYLRTFGRNPLENEWAAIRQTMAEAGADGREGALEDLFWALLNSKEFYFNH